VKVLLDQELIITSGREAPVQHSLAGEEARCFRLFLPVSGRPACRHGRGTLRAPYIIGASIDIAGGVDKYL
jgi:hypothetical protein